MLKSFVTRSIGIHYMDVCPKKELFASTPLLFFQLYWVAGWNWVWAWDVHPEDQLNWLIIHPSVTLGHLIAKGRHRRKESNILSHCRRLVFGNCINSLCELYLWIYFVAVCEVCVLYSFIFVCSLEGGCSLFWPIWP